MGLPPVPGFAALTVAGQMPASAQAIVSALLTLALLLVAGAAVKRRDARDLAALAGGGLAVLMEALACFLSGIVHPAPGNWSLYTALGVSVPFYMLPAYALFFWGATHLARALGPHGPRWWTAMRAFAIFYGANFVVEAAIMAAGLWSYAGQQPIVIATGQPLWSGLANTAAAALFAAIAVPTGQRLARGIVLAPLGATLGYTATALPVALHLRNPGSSAGLALTASAVICGLCVYILGASLARTPIRPASPAEIRKGHTV